MIELFNDLMTKIHDLEPVHYWSIESFHLAEWRSFGGMRISASEKKRNRLTDHDTNQTMNRSNPTGCQ